MVHIFKNNFRKARNAHVIGACDVVYALYCMTLYTPHIPPGRVHILSLEHA